MAHIGHPIAGDPVYGGRRGRQGHSGDERFAELVAALGRQALHACRLGFVHPASGAQLRFDSELPADLKALL
jgi:23S rRNA pseudouridine1911/1915/1917 synthase